MNKINTCRLPHISSWRWWKKQRNLSLLHFFISFQNNFTKSPLKARRLHQYGTSMFSVCHLETEPLRVMHLGFVQKKTGECMNSSHNYFLGTLITHHRSRLWEEYFVTAEDLSASRHAKKIANEEWEIVEDLGDFWPWWIPILMPENELSPTPPHPVVLGISTGRWHVCWL